MVACICAGAAKFNRFAGGKRSDSFYGRFPRRFVTHDYNIGQWFIARIGYLSVDNIGDVSLEIRHVGNTGGD